MPVQRPSSTPALMIAGTASGVGKTTVTAGLLAALRRRGLKVQPFKCGPDYIDPSYHTRAAGLPCRNLDSWMLDDSQVAATFARAAAGADLAVIEGVMGLYDGSDFEGERASAAQLAKLLHTPVLVVIDISGAARSAAATALGFARFDPAVPVAGFILNFAGSENHARGCAAAIKKQTGLPVVGWLARDDQVHISERHLGLVLAGERKDPDALTARTADAVEAGFDLDLVLRIAATAKTPSAPPAPAARKPKGPAPVLAVARDDAFAFYYPDNLELLEEAGAEIAFFSPVAGGRPPANAAGVYLGGGYPELHAAALSANDGLRRDLLDLDRRGAPIFAECGGFMVLAETLDDGDGHRWPMYGLIPGVTRMTPGLVGLGYREATALDDNLLLPRGASVRGHEFHNSTWEAPPAPAAWRLRGTAPGAPQSSDGVVRGNLLASYLHLPFAQNPALAARFVDKLRSSARSTQ